MKMLLRIVGWTLRASALICIVWTLGQVIGGQLSTPGAILGAVVWHAGFALGGVALVGAGATPVTNVETAQE
jgi:hypothetical protein